MRGNVLQLDLSIAHHLPEPVLLDLYVFGPTVIHWILGEGDCALVVPKDDNGREVSGFMRPYLP